jgi:hypothetical protein
MRLDIFPDVKPALHRLPQYRQAILSNGSTAMPAPLWRMTSQIAFASARSPNWVEVA